MEDEKRAIAKLEFLKREYWQARNGQRNYLRCPYCRPFAETPPSRLRKNYVGQDNICCPLFLRALWAIMDRQDQLDLAERDAMRDLLARQEQHLLN